MSAESSGKPTIYAVAERAGVSISTVSRVLNDSPSVTDATRGRVLAAMDYLRYRPDRTARSLAQRRRRTMAVAVPTFTTPFHNEVLKGVREGVGSHDVDLLLWDLEWRHVHRSLLQFLRRGAVDGLLLVGVEPDEAVARELRALRAPVVLVGPHWAEFDCFHWDHVAGARLAVEHLLRQGHRHVGMIVSPLPGQVREQRVQGYREALAAYGLPFRPERVCSGTTRKHAGYSEEAGCEAMCTLLTLEPSLTAVFASSDVQAVGAWKAVREAGLRVPDDMALIGYDDVKASAFLGLSSVAQTMHEVGVQAAEACVARVVGGGATTLRQAVQIMPRLNVRASSRPLAGTTPAPRPTSQGDLREPAAHAARSLPEVAEPRTRAR